MTNFNFSTLNNPKHLVALGREAGKQMTRSGREDLWYRINDNFRRLASVSSSYYCLVPVPQNRMRYGDLDIIVCKEALPSAWKSRLSAKVFDNAEALPIPGTDTVVFLYRGYQVNVHVVETVNQMRRASIYLGNQGLMSLIQIVGESIGIKYDMNTFALITGIEKQPLIDIPYSQYTELRMMGFSTDFIVYHIYENSDIFKAVYTGQYFNRQVFLDLESKPDYAERVAKNPNLKAFVDHLKANPRISGEVKFDANAPRSRLDFTNMFSSYAPATMSQYKELAYTSKLSELVQAKFSIEKMAAVTELPPDRLKIVMDLFAQAFKNEKEFNQFIITSLPETINAHILAVREKRFPNGVDIILEQAKAAAKAKRGPITEKVAKKVAADKIKAELKKVKPTTKKAPAKPKKADAISAPAPVEALDASFALAA